MNYLTGWFIIDFLAIFPFQVMFSGGLMLKLVRLGRMPRMIKLLDESRFKTLLVKLDGVSPSLNKIESRYRIMTIYKMFRLITIMIIMVYGVACVYYLFSDYLKRDSEPNFLEEFGLKVTLEDGTLEQDDLANLITMMYFSTTILSTVGYGDYSPIATHEMIITIIVMLAGVAMFAWLMSEAEKEITAAMDLSDKKGPLNHWFRANERFGGIIIKKL